MTSVGGSGWDIPAELEARVPAAGRVLDVGCGDGALVRRLRELGFDAEGVDPEAPAEPGLVRSDVEALPGEGRYDGACAVMSLHHADLEAVCAALVRMLRPGAILLVSEFSWTDYDERASRWVMAHEPSPAPDSDHDHDHEGEHPHDNTVAGWEREHAGLHDGAAIRAALARWLIVEEVRSAPYLATMIGRPEFEAEEQGLIESGALPALGLLLRCRR